MTRVLLVLHEDVLGGATRAVLRPADVLRRRGDDIRVWCSAPSPLHEALVGDGWPVAGVQRLMRWRLRSLRHPPGVRARLRSFLRSLAAFRRHLLEQDPELVCVNGRLALAEGLVARVSGYPVVAYIHDARLPGAYGLIARVAPWLAAQRVIAASPSHAQTMRVGGRRPDVVPECAPLRDGIDCLVKPAGAPLVVGTIGVPSRRKGTDVFVAMAERLLGSGARIEFRIAGEVEEGPEEGWARGQIERAGDLGIRHLGHVDVEAQLREWDVMVMPSRADPFPLAVLEAMAAAVTVVGVRRDGIAEQLADGGGVLVDPDDPAALAEAVLALASDPVRRGWQGAAGQARVAAAFTPARTADALEAVWRSAIGG